MSDIDAMDEVIRAAITRVAEQGTENASPNDLILAGFGWLGNKQHKCEQDLSKFEQIKKTGLPIGGGAGFGIVILELLKVMLGTN